MTFLLINRAVFQVVRMWAALFELVIILGTIVGPTLRAPRERSVSITSNIFSFELPP